MNKILQKIIVIMLLVLTCFNAFSPAIYVYADEGNITLDEAKDSLYTLIYDEVIIDQGPWESKVETLEDIIDSFINKR